MRLLRIAVLMMSAGAPLLSLKSQAPERPAISGRVVDSSTGEPLANVQVQLADTGHRVRSDVDGRFSIAGVRPGSYTLHVSTVGYYLVTQAFTLIAGEPRAFDVVLTPTALGRTDSVEVAAEVFDPVRQTSPGQLELAGNEAVNLASVLADDPLRAVHTLPGVASNNDFVAEFSLRGAGPERLGIYLDGILLHMPYHLVAGYESTGSLTMFNTDLLEAVVLHSGVPPLSFSEKSAGGLEL